MISATVNHYRLRFFNDKDEELMNLKTANIAVPEKDSLFFIDKVCYKVTNVVPNFVTDPNKYPYMQYLITVKELWSDKQ